MSSLLYLFVLTLTFLPLNNGQRRILNGKTVESYPSYVVYFLNAGVKVHYDAWLCGGAIVSAQYILTSAACLEDVEYLYAIAGYTKYVKYEDINTDKCTKEHKKKIVAFCIPVSYEFEYPRVEKWARVDIALAKVDSPYSDGDSYGKYCSYNPREIAINYDKKYQAPGTDALVFGWGHNNKWRKEDDVRDYNQEHLQYAAVKLADKTECKEHFKSDGVKEIIEKFMVCTMDKGELDENGNLDHKVDPSNLPEDCGPGLLRRGNKCLYDPNYRRNVANATYIGSRRTDSKQFGICQNDHGGPLVTWRGPKPIVIGVASVFRVEENSKECMGPFLYASTLCSGKFLECVLREEGQHGITPDEARRRCDLAAKEMGLTLVRRSISWIGHPDGPAKNELGRRANGLNDTLSQTGNETIIEKELVTLKSENKGEQSKDDSTEKRDEKSNSDNQKSKDGSQKFSDTLPRGINHEKGYENISTRPVISVLGKQ